MKQHEDNPDSLTWYKLLTLAQRFALKEMCIGICGMRWEDFTILFSPRERLEIIYGKLKLEGLIKQIDNMPEQLQESSVLNERIEELDSLIEEL